MRRATLTPARTGRFLADFAWAALAALVINVVLAIIIFGVGP
jgi:hypothetical protein